MLAQPPVAARRALATVVAPRWIALALAFLTLALRLPLQSQTLNDWDSVNHALALTGFDVVAHRPQPPGYILYIGLGRLAQFVWPDPQSALVAVSILAAVVAVVLLYFLGRRVVSPTVGLIAALLLATSPAFWFDSLVALPYVVEGCFSIAVAYLLYRVLAGEANLAPLAAVVFAGGIGARQMLSVFLGPLALYVYWKQSRRARLEGLGWFTLVCLIWFVPMVASAGGLAGYLTALRALNAAFGEEYVVAGAGGLAALARNVSHLAAYTAYAANLALVPVLLALWHVARDSRLRERLRDPRVVWMALWLVPSWLFYTLAHMGSPGLVYVFLPALLLIAAVYLGRWFAPEPRAGGVSWRAGAVALLCGANAFIFLGTPTDLYLGRSLRVLNYSSLVAHDRYLTTRVSAIRGQFDPQTTLVLATDWRFAEYYLPEYRVLFFVPAGNPPLLLARDRTELYTSPGDPALGGGSTESIVLFDAGARPFYRGAALDCVSLADGSCLAYARAAGTVEIGKDAVENP